MYPWLPGKGVMSSPLIGVWHGGVIFGGWQCESVLHPQQFIVAHQEKNGDNPVNDFVYLGIFSFI